MSIPAALDTTVYPVACREEYGLADVETGGVGIITSLRFLLVTTLGWSEPSTALFKTPVTAGGRFLDVLVTRIDSTHLEWRVRNQLATTICTRRITLTNPSTVRYFCSTMHAVVELLVTDSNTSETLQAYMYDMAPNLESDHTLYVFGAGLRNTSNTQSNECHQAGLGFGVNNGSVVDAYFFGPLMSYILDGNIQAAIDQTGREIIRLCQSWHNFAGTVRLAGNVCHAMVCDGNTLTGGAERQIYIDTSTAVRFKVLGQTIINNTRMMLRKTTNI